MNNLFRSNERKTYNRFIIHKREIVIFVVFFFFIQTYSKAIHTLADVNEMAEKENLFESDDRESRRIDRTHVKW